MCDIGVGALDLGAMSWKLSSPPRALNLKALFPQLQKENTEACLFSSGFWVKKNVSRDFVAIVLLSCDEFHIYTYYMGPGRKTSNLKININAEPLHRGTLVWLYGIPIAIDKSPLMLSSLLKVTKKKIDNA